jgi:hypothetical protein
MQDYDNETATMLNKVNAPGATRESLVQHYAKAILAPVHMDWDTVNDAIVHRWGDCALAYINREAWYRITERGV